MIRTIKKGLILVLMLSLAGCSVGSSRGQPMEDIKFQALHETQPPSIALSGDFTLTYECKAESESGTLDGSELEISKQRRGTDDSVDPKRGRDLRRSDLRRRCVGQGKSSVLGLSLL